MTAALKRRPHSLHSPSFHWQSILHSSPKTNGHPASNSRSMSLSSPILPHLSHFEIALQHVPFPEFPRQVDGDWRDDDKADEDDFAAVHDIFGRSKTVNVCIESL